MCVLVFVSALVSYAVLNFLVESRVALLFLILDVESASVEVPLKLKIRF